MNKNVYSIITCYSLQLEAIQISVKGIKKQLLLSILGSNENEHI